MSSASQTPSIPSAPQPLYPDVPWWSVLLTAFIFSIVSVIATVVIMRSGIGKSGTFAIPSAGGLALDTLVYMPHIILLFGVLADMFTYDGVWSIPSLVGVLSIFVNFVFKYFWIGLDEIWNTTMKAIEKGSAGPAATAATAAPPSLTATTTGGKRGSFGTTYDGCSVQGFESLASEYAPQTLVVTATVFSYYCFDLIRNRGWVNSIAALSFFVLTYIGQVAIVATTNDNGGCEVPGAIKQYGAISQGFRALVEGITIGGTSYGIVQTYYPSRLPSSTVSPFPRKTAADLTPGPDGTMRDADGYPYVVLPNGQAVPDLGSAAARNAFASIASNNLGTGTPATACNIGANAPDAARLAQIASIASTT
jgi:uncharacterized membrane protein